jgi:tripartite-type tricarboxylate transporter receptor subunit TctC
MKNIKRVAQLALVASLAWAAAPVSALAQSYPDKPIRILIPFPPGGGTDFVSRMVGTKLAELTGWQVVLENRPGAGGNLAIEAASKAPADGYTLVMGQTDNMMLGPWLYPSLTYDSVKSFAPVIQVSVTPAAIGSAANSKIKTPMDMIAKGKTPEGLRWATAGAGTLGHLVGEDFKKRADINLLQVPYKGASPAMTDVMGGQVDVYIGSLASLLPHVKSGKLNAVAVTTAKRASQAPDTMTMQEGGVKDMDASIWVGLFAPAGTPPAVIERINKEVNRVLKTPETAQKIEAGGVNVVGGSSKDFAEFVKKDYANWGRIVKESGVKLN